jgi:hypothetical protein
MKLFEDVLVGVAVKFFAVKKSFSVLQEFLVAQSHFLQCPITKYNVHRLGIVGLEIILNAELIILTKKLVLNISKTCEDVLKLSINRLKETNIETMNALP